MAIAAILATNLIGIFMNYGAFRSEQYDIRAPMVGCDYYSQPACVFVARREVIRKHVLTALGALLRRTLLEPSIGNAMLAVGAVLLVTAAAAVLRTVLLTRQFGASVSDQRVRAEFG